MTIKDFKKQFPDMEKSYEAMSHKDLLKEMYLISIDSKEMIDRVSLFMEECTDETDLNYSLKDIRAMIEHEDKNKIDDFCYYEVSEDQTDEEILKSIRKHASSSEQ